MESLNIDNLEIKVKKENSHISISWMGKSDNRNPSASLIPYFNGMIDEIKGNSLRIDFTKLEYMNSSSVIPIIQFIKQLEGAAIPTEVVYDGSSSWQKKSFEALEKICNNLKNVNVKGI
ncbi:MAG: hypothetical protein H7A23_23135 [Leptospiraceae bacterium]|nr:hypothetical protein [Leptospiraceae bacterium]MCP5497461.1 hypothetical protein [Leptospiraceae bacterium]